MNEIITYSEKYLIKSSEVNSKLELTISSLLKIIQNLSVSGAEYINVGIDKTTLKGYLWVFTKLEINITRMPKYLEEVVLYTYPNNMIHFIYPRTFLITDLDGNELISAKSLWVLIDKSSRKVLLPSFTKVETPLSSPMDKISNIEEKKVKLRETRTVRYTDTDLNGHLNNTRYLDFILDLYDSSYFENKTINNINIIFHQEAKEFDSIDILSSDDNTYYVFERDNKKIFECNIK